MSLLKTLAVGAVAALAIFKVRSRSKPARDAEVASTPTGLEEVAPTDAVLVEVVPAKAPKKRRRSANRRSTKIAKTA